MNKNLIAGIITIILIIGFVVAMAYLYQEKDDEEDRIYESYTEMKSVFKNIYGEYWTGQTFIVNEGHYINRVRLYMSKIGIPEGEVTISIRETIEQHPGWFIPTGEDLVSTSMDCMLLPDTSAEWIDFTLSDTYLEEGKTYAIIVRGIDADANNCPRWERLKGEGDYENGTAVGSHNSGESWGRIENDDYLFEEYGHA